MLKLSFSIVILSILLTPSVARQRIAASETPPAADTVARTEPPASDGTAALPRPAADTVSAMTLDACMAYAVEHNPNVRQQIYANRNYRQEYIASIAALVPSISASASVTTTFVDAHDLSSVEGAIQENTRAIYIETLGNPNSDIPDIDTVELLHTVCEFSCS